ncbi:alkaline phosphatase family protein [Elioraea sp.]|uniref:alkaline phosphatase family protein n=1 Tax=Elioraea sp. TaxID=2185103 RepID=UPI003F72FBFC
MPLTSRVVLFGFDGLRPDRVTETTMPHLARFMAGGTVFANARSVFPSETRVAIPSLTTGCRPGTHGLVANSLYDAAAAPGRVLNTKNAADIEALVAAHGRLLAVPSLGARLAAAGKALDVVWTGTVGAGRAFFPEACALDAFRWHPEEAVGPARGLEARFGAAPPATTPNTPRVRHAARLFVEHVLAERPAEVAAFWSSEPDVTYHYRGVGSAEAEAAMRAVDAAFADVLRWRETQPDRDGIVVIALSDHGHVTGEAHVDLRALLRDGGFAAGRDFGTGTEIALGGGGAPGLWLRDSAHAPRLAAWLNAQPWSGLVLAREDSVPGTIPLAALGARHARSPDLAVTFAGSSAPDVRGVPGRGLIDTGDVPVGGGMHGGLHQRELATVLAMAGGPILPGAVMRSAADLTDVAPSILALLGMPAEGMDGRALAQAWGQAPDADPVREVLQPMPGRPGLALFRTVDGCRPDGMTHHRHAAAPP